MTLPVFDTLTKEKCCGTGFVAIPTNLLFHTVKVKDATVPYKYTPPANAFGKVKLGYEAVDAKGSLCKSHVDVTISPVNDGPEAKDDVFNLDANRGQLKGVDCAKTPRDCTGLFSKLTVPISTLLENDVDVDGQQLTLVEVTGTPVFGKLEKVPTGSKNALVYLPTTGYKPGDPFFLATDELSYKVVDDKPAEDVSTGTITLVVRKPVTVCSDGTSFESKAPTLTTDRVCTACSSCAATETKGGLCQTPTQCIAAGSFIKSSCAAGKDRVCAPLTMCNLVTQFEHPPPQLGTKPFNKAMFITDRNCLTLSVCSSLNFESVPSNGHVDRKCAKARVCTSAEFEASALTKTEDRVCKPLTDCQAGTFISKENNKTADRVCSTCSADTYQDGKNAARCKKQTICAAGTFITSDSTTAIRKCVACKTGTFQVKKDHRELTCTQIATCPPGTRIAKDHTTTTDQTCAQCDGKTNWQSKSDQAKCDKMTVCAVGKETRIEGTPRMDRTCRDCKAGTTFQDQAGQTTCKPVHECDIGKEESVNPTLERNRQCEDCKDGFYQDGKGETVCKAVTQCKAGKQEKQRQTTKTDRVCEPCSSTTFQPVASGTHVCRTHATCKSITNHNLAPRFQNGAKNRDLRCILHPNTTVAGCKRSLAS